MGLQVLLALLLLKFPGSQEVFLWLNEGGQGNRGIHKGRDGIVFGYLGGAVLPFDEKIPGSSYILAFRGLPLLLVIGALSSLFFYWRIIPLGGQGFLMGLETGYGYRRG